MNYILLLQELENDLACNYITINMLKQDERVNCIYLLNNHRWKAFEIIESLTMVNGQYINAFTNLNS